MAESEVLEKISEKKVALRESEEKVVTYILTHWQEVLHLPITELAKRMGVSEATMVRTYKKMGFRGFQN